jgi:uncharacterized pyridoxal phosphate-containing UPF0001 family protein
MAYHDDRVAGRRCSDLSLGGSVDEKKDFSKVRENVRIGHQILGAR